MKSFVLFALMLCSTYLFAQNKFIDIEGKVINSIDSSLLGATVVLLQKQDSIINTFVFTQADGSFKLKHIAIGEYLLQIDYLGYDQYIQTLTVIEGSKNMMLGNISLTSSSVLIDQLTVKAKKIPFFMKKDTLVYNADAFKTRPSDVVEDLLKQLPGVKVEHDGTININGEKVKQLLVDGKEFFGSEVQTATKNLPASSVDKVEIFDKQSKEAEFTGVDDGRSEKTINLELKSDYKQGMFGNLMAGYGTEDSYKSRFMVNKYDKHQRITLMGNLNNTNEISLSGQGFNALRNKKRNVVMTPIKVNDYFLPEIDGFSTNSNIGLNINRNFGEDILINSSYFFGRVKNENNIIKRRESLLNGSAFSTDELTDQKTIDNNHQMYMTIEHKSNLTLTTSISFIDNRLNSHSAQKSINDAGITENSSQTDKISQDDKLNFSSQLQYRKRLNNKGRTLTAEGVYNIQNIDKNLQLTSISEIFNSNNNQQDVESLLQNQFELIDQTTYGVDLRYTEPIGKGKLLQFEYSRQQIQDNLQKDVFNKSDKGIQLLDEDLSNEYARNYFYDQAKLSLTWNKGISNLNFHLIYHQSNIDGKITRNPQIIQKSYRTFLPSIYWKIDSNGPIKFNTSYHTTLKVPSFVQLQPLVDNTNPFDQYIGNPDLLPEYTHSLNTKFSFLNHFSGIYLRHFINVDYTKNKISNSVSIDKNLRRLTTPTNVGHDLRISSSLSLHSPIKPLKISVNISPSFSYNESSLLVNQVKDYTKRYNSNIRLGIGNIDNKIITLSTGVNFNHSITKYMESIDLNNNYSNLDFNVKMVVDLFKSWAIGSDFSYSSYSGGGLSNEKRNIYLWNGFIETYVFKKKGIVKFSANDILNKNTNINQITHLNYSETTQTRPLKRYFMLSFNYIFNTIAKQGS